MSKANPVAAEHQKMPTRAAIASLDETIRQMDRDYSTDPKGFFKERDGNVKAQALRDELNGLVSRLHKFISHN